ncbi:helix-turn-helix transcriptional regulator [Streptomyces erythrochromogenes]|uniref:helix-turn-helix transcriptional regulator n=1 Tax=Streptomyces erythrochromogenes TaxID=285574 RepID=UPI00331C9872
MDFDASGNQVGEKRPYCAYCKLGKKERWDKETEWIRHGFLRIPDLTDRELQMFHAMTCGPSNDELAKGLGMTIRTVKFHLENIRGKLGGISRVQTCLLAVHHRIAACPTGHLVT